MSDTEKVEVEDKKVEDKPRSTAEADITKYKVRDVRNFIPRPLPDRPAPCSTPVCRSRQTAADIVHGVMKKLVEQCVEGAKVLDLCVKADQLIEHGTGAVYNKAVKGVKVTKGAQTIHYSSSTLLNVH